MKFAVATDPKTGVRIGVPERLLTKRDVNPNGGTRWQSVDQKITLDTRAIPPGETDLAALYERNLAIQTPGRQVTYKVLRPDFFVIGGETPTGKFYIRYASGPAGLRGFSLGYDKTLKDFDRTVVAIANSFAPFPEAAPVVAAGPATPPRPASLIASGIAVAPRRVLTTAGVEGCPDLCVAQAKARVVKADKAKGLALLEWEEARTPGPLALQASSQAGGEDLVVLSFSGPEPSLVATTAEAVSGGLVAPLQPGASGGAAFARSGALVGLVGALPATPRMVAGVVPPMAHPLIAAEAVASFLTDNGVALPAAAESEAQRSAGEIASTMGSCGPSDRVRALTRARPGTEHLRRDAPDPERQREHNAAPRRGVAPDGAEVTTKVFDRRASKRPLGAAHRRPRVDVADEIVESPRDADRQGEPGTPQTENRTSGSPPPHAAARAASTGRRRFQKKILDHGVDHGVPRITP